MSTIKSTHSTQSDQKNLHRFSVRVKLIVFAISVFLIASILATVVSVQITRSALTETLQQTLIDETDADAELIRSQLIWVRSVAIDLAASAEVLDYTEESIKANIENTLRRNEQVFGSTIAYEPGKFQDDMFYWSPYYSRTSPDDLTFTQLGNPDYNYFQWDWYTVPKETKEPVLSPPYFDEGGGERWMVTWSAPFFDNDDQVKGVATADISFAQTQDIVNNIHVGENGYAFLIDSKGTVLGIGQDPDNLYEPMISSMVEIAQKKEAFDWENLVENMRASESGFTPEAIIDPSGREMFVAYTPVGLGTDWSLALAFPADQLFAPVSDLQRILIISSAVIALVFGTILYVFAGNIVRPIGQLVNQAQEFAAGHLKLGSDGQLEKPIQIRTNDEFEDLGDAFNQMATQVAQNVGNLEEKVAARTHQLELVAQIGQQLGGILSLDTLLAQIVTLTKEAFDYYHVHIYLLKDDRLVLAEGYGPAGEEMKASGHSIPLDTLTSLVVRAARTQEIVIVDNVREVEDWLPNPLLPDTRSEMAVPIMLRDRVVGVLDVQVDKIAGLDDVDAKLLHTLANQIAVAIRNARSFEQVETALAEAHQTQAVYTQKAWQKTNVAVPGRYYIHTQSEDAASDTHKQQVLTKIQQQVYQQEQPAVVDVGDNEIEGSSLVAPITLRNNVIGAMQVHNSDSTNRVWSDEDLELIGLIAEQFAQTAESLRLFDDTRQKAAQERDIREITDKLRSAPNLNALLETAAQELGQRLNIQHTVLELGTEANVSAKSNGHSQSHKEVS